ncbi:N-acetylglucosamine transport system permease protein [Kribbella sp. VKM Ac-2527]|jgi:N-acetylglucosamine transport system permease protein|uniref:N-acetylglucosamine transport system permease protein n=1 Tax=Kribbella caucasensis TaxID=2512215 RepID=A0A4R6K3R8_9ACTN|nr:sugar ABC transporter permease [Kribbella sp. VKM Ac-2527]TDO43983.1 N-acetylglucosamine transport system permease protein [Kribbella sp. VKM Ac-2527]
MRHGSYRFVASFLAIPLALYAIFVISPFVQAFYYSLTDWTGISPEFNFVGFDNFQTLARDAVFRQALGHNLILLIGLPLITIFLALVFAYLLNVGGRANAAGVQGVRGNGFYKLAFFLPQVLSVPVIAVIWATVMTSTDTGLLNSFTKAIGLGTSEYLADPNIALYCVMWVLIWGSVGFYLVLFNAAMSGIPKDIFEAAIIDGAGRFATFYRITLPLLWDTIQTSWVYLAILALDAYALVAVMTAGPGGPDNSTQVMGLQIADNGFQYGRAGYASAMGVVLFFLTLIIAAVMLRATRRDRIEY